MEHMFSSSLRTIAAIRAWSSPGLYICCQGLTTIYSQPERAQKACQSTSMTVSAPKRREKGYAREGYTFTGIQIWASTITP